MTDTRASPAVALLFADGDLGAHLREALDALGARIVHEGPAAQVQRETLADCGAEVVVVNLAAADEEHLEQLYDVLGDSGCTVVFNDAQASRELSGWDKARWARHLAAKLVGSGDVDPPRPTGAPIMMADAVAAAAPGAAAGSQGHTGSAIDVDADGEPTLVLEPTRETLSHHGATAGQRAAELEELMVDGAARAREGGTDPMLGTTYEPASADAVPSALMGAGRRGLADATASGDHWELVDPDATPPAAPTATAEPSDFGIEKMQPAAYLAPDSDEDATSTEPEFTMELESLEESLAPELSVEPVSEMLLDAHTGGIGRVVAVGVGADGASDVRAFLNDLPDDLPAVVVLIQHQRDPHVEELAEALDNTTRLPVKAAATGSVARAGEVWLVPPGKQCRVRRDGRIMLDGSEGWGLGDPSIDRCFALLATDFGAHVTAIVLSGNGHDALAGAQEVHGHGGHVWLQEPASCGDDAMAALIDAEGLATFTGTPAELARHLCETCA